jgi:hypothetical protein
MIAFFFGNESIVREIADKDSINNLITDDQNNKQMIEKMDPDG